MDADERAAIVHDLKIRLTAISGYAQMVERQAAREGNASFKQRVYISKLRRLINELVVAVHQYEQQTDQRWTSIFDNKDSGPVDIDLRVLNDFSEK